jgi:hypothetical protein
MTIALLMQNTLKAFKASLPLGVGRENSLPAK